MARVVSETDLQRIDKRATFATHAMVQPAELLARLVNILGYIPPPPDDDEPEPVDMSTYTGGGVQLFSEKEILASEASPWSSAPVSVQRHNFSLKQTKSCFDDLQTSEPIKWKLGADTPKRARSRAASEIRLDHPSQFLQPNACEWTWSGPVASHKIQEMMRARKNTVIPETSTIKDGKSRFLGLPSKKALLPRWVRLLKKPQESSQDVEAQDTDEVSDPQPQTPGGKFNIFLFCKNSTKEQLFIKVIDIK